MKQIPVQKLVNRFESEDDKLLKVELGFNLLEKLINNGQYNDVQRYGYKILDLVIELDHKEYLIMILIEIGNSHILQGEYTKSTEFFERAFFLADEIKDHYHLAKIYYHLSILETYNSNLNAALNFAFDAVKKAEEFGYNDILEYTYHHIGEIYTELNKFEYALEYYKKSINITDREHRFGKFWSLGKLYNDMGEYTIALGYLKRALSYYEKHFDFHKHISCYLLMSEVYLKRNKYALAIKSAEVALRKSSENHLEVYYANAVLALAEIYLCKKNFKKANHYFNAFKKKEKIIQNKKTLLEFYYKFAQYNKRIKNYPIAYEYIEKYIKLKDFILDKEMMTRINFLTENHEFEQKKKEAEIFRLKNVELVKSNKLIEEKNEELMELNEINSNLMYSISHDLKNYLGSIQMALETAITKDNMLGENKFINLIKLSNQRALNLVKDMLYSKKIELTEQSIQLTSMNINDFVNAIEEDLLIRAKNKNIELNIEYHCEPLICMIDDDKFHRIIDNLFTNALKFTHNNGKIQIRTEKDNNNAKFSIKDSGIGIPKENIPKLFQKFSGIGRKGTAGEESTGLGLSIVNRLVEMHNGTIIVESEIGNGSTFVVKLPLTVQ